MTAQILDGLALSNQMKSALKEKIHQEIQAGNPAPCLAVILIGEHPASKIYVKRKQEACQFVGIQSHTQHLPEDITEAEILKLIDQLNENSRIHGILVQLPLPPHLHTQTIFERISPSKDVDGFNPCNLGKLAQRHPALRPCTPYGIIKLLEAYSIPLRGMNAVIIGCSNIVGRPMAFELLLTGCTVTICHRFTKNLEQPIQQADLLVAAIGNPGVIQSQWIKQGAVVIDVGINRQPDGKIRGDLDFNTAKEKAGWITPVPGGVGPMTVATLLENTWLASRSRPGHTR